MQRVIVNAEKKTWAELVAALLALGFVAEHFHATTVSIGEGSIVDFATGTPVQSYEKEHYFAVRGETIIDVDRHDVTNNVVGEWHLLLAVEKKS